MEALVELFIAMLNAIAGLFMAAVAAIAFAFELLFTLLFYGPMAAREKRAQRRAKKQVAAAETPQTQTSGSVLPTGVAIGLVAIGLIGWWLVADYFERIEQQRIAATKQQARDLVAQFADEIKQLDRIPKPGKLPETDSWGQPLELFVDEFATAILIIVRSPGPDQTPGNLDDLFSLRTVTRDVKHVAKKAVEGGLDAVKNRFQRLFPGNALPDNNDDSKDDN